MIKLKGLSLPLGAFQIKPAKDILPETVSQVQPSVVCSVLSDRSPIDIATKKSSALT
jgi:hypothetical protein